MPNYIFKTANPERSIVVTADNREEADQKFEQMRDAASLTAESTIVSVEESNIGHIIEHAELAEKEAAESEGEGQGQAPAQAE